MKVLLINNCHWRRGGSEAVYFGTAELLLKAGHEVVFLSVSDKNNIHTGEKEYFVVPGSGYKKIIQYFTNSVAAATIEDIIIKEAPDVAHAHLLWGGLTASIIPVLHKYGIPFVHTAHDYRMVCPAYLFKDGKGHQCERCKGGHFLNCMRHRCSKGNLVESVLMTLEMYYRNSHYNPLQLIDGFVFVSNFSRNKHIEFDPGFQNVTSMVLYNCPDDKVTESLNINLDTYNNYFLFYGRLSAEKGVATLIRAFERLTHLQLLIVGTGPLEDELKQYVDTHKMSNVQFAGYKFGKELYDIVAKAKYVCVSSECYENNPMTIVEAYSLRTPVIGAAIGGITEVIKPGETGYTFKSGDADSLVEVISKASTINKVQYEEQKTKAFEFSQQNFGREIYLKRLISFYKDVMNKENKEQ